MKKKLKLLIPLLFLMLLGAGMVTFAASPEEEEQNVISLVNSERQNAGVAGLKTSDELQAAADIRARELAQYFSHDRPDGTECFTVLNGTLVDQLAYTAGENIAMGFETGSSVMTGWMNSPGHRSNILDVDYTHIGVGCYDDGEYRYWVQLFAGIDTSFTGMMQNQYGWWYLTNGEVDWNYTGMAENEYGWWYITNGAVDWNYTGMAYNEYGWWYITNGAVDWNYTGMAYNDYGWWYMTNGMVNWDYEGMAQNEYGWWYMRNGTVDWNYTGMAENQYGWWYMTNGAVNWNYNGPVEFNGRTFNVVNGYAGK